MGQLCEGLAARGHEVSVLTTFPHYERFRVWDQYRGKLFESDLQKGVDIKRTWVYAPNGSKQNMLNRLLSYLSFNALATIAGSASRRDYDVILCSNGSFFSGLAATIIGRFKGAPFIYNVQDLYPETRSRPARSRTNSSLAHSRNWSASCTSRPPASASSRGISRQPRAQTGSPRQSRHDPELRRRGLYSALSQSELVQPRS